MEIKNRVCVITGAGQGLGLEMAKSLASKGAKLALVDMNTEKLSIAVDLCMKQGASEARWYISNVTQEKEVVDTFNKIVDDMGPISALVNNAGITRDGLLLKVSRETGKVESSMSLDNWQAVLDVNLTGTFLCGREAAKHMVNQSTKGCIINISSISRHGNMGQTNYTATKSAVEAMAVTWAKELSRYGIRSNSIAPGYIGTEMVMSMKPEALDKISSGIPAKRLGDPSEIAKTVCFILDNDYANGRCFEVDGGLRI